MKNEPDKRIKRGERSWNYFWMMYALTLAFTLSIINAIPFCWYWKLTVIVLSFLLLGWLCLLNAWFENRILGLQVKLETKWRKI